MYVCFKRRIVTYLTIRRAADHCACSSGQSGEHVCGAAPSAGGISETDRVDYHAAVKITVAQCYLLVDHTYRFYL